VAVLDASFALRAVIIEDDYGSLYRASSRGIECAQYKSLETITEYQ
jgi:hypothetical protein